MQKILIPSAKVLSAWERMSSRLRRLKATINLKLLRHPLQPGQTFYSPGRVFKYRVVGACCRLYDREQLPYPSCSLEFKGKQPSWRRIGRRFVPDVAAKTSPSYCVELVDYPEAAPVVMTLHWLRLSPEPQRWWYSKRLSIVAESLRFGISSQQRQTANNVTA